MANGKPLGNMKVILDLDSSAFSKGLNGAKKSVAYNMKAMQSQMKVMNSSGDKLGALQTALAKHLVQTKSTWAS